MAIFYKKWKKYKLVSLLTKNKMDLNIRKMTNHPTSHASNQKREWFMLLIWVFVPPWNLKLGSGARGRIDSKQGEKKNEIFDTYKGNSKPNKVEMNR